MKLNRLLVFNLATDADDPVLGFTTVWLQALASQCRAVDVLTMRVGDVDLPRNVHVYSVGKEKQLSEVQRAIEFYRIISELLASYSYEACFAHMMPLFANMAAPLLKLKGIPITLWYAHKSVTWHLWLAEKLVDNIVTASPESFRLPSQKLKIIGHGIDTNIFIPEKDLNTVRPFTILTVGRIAPIKQIDLLIEAAYKLKTKMNVADFEVRVVGVSNPQDAAYGMKVQNQVFERRLSQIVKFVGPLKYEDTISEYQNADVMVNLSDTGSVDKAVLEAMSCGTPIITSNSAFDSVLLDKELKNWIIKDKDIEQLKERLCELMSMSRQSRLGLGMQLRQIVVNNHDLQKLARAILHVSVESGRNAI